MKRISYFFFAVIMFTSCSSKTASDESQSPVKVQIVEVKKVTGTSFLQYSGTIEPSQTIPLTFQTTGTVEQILVQVGDVVHKGQLLATVDKADAQSMYELTNAKYQQAMDAYNRLKEVYDNGSLPEIKWVEMESNLQQAKSSLAIAKTNLKKTNLYSPDNGVIGKRNIEPGMSSIGSVINPLELVKIENVYVKIAVPENEIGKIKKGLTATFRVSALNDQLFQGVVTSVGVVANQVSRTYDVKITVKNQGLVLKPGMVCDVKLNIAANEEIVAIPYSAVDIDKDKSKFVYVVDVPNKKVNKRIIQVGNYQNSDIEILSGLSLGEKVVCEGKQKLSDNSKITL